MSLILHDGRPLTDRKLPKEIWDTIFEERQKWFDKHYDVYVMPYVYIYHMNIKDNNVYYEKKCKGYDKYYHVKSKYCGTIHYNKYQVYMHKHIENKHPSME